MIDIHVNLLKLIDPFSYLENILDYHMKRDL